MAKSKGLLELTIPAAHHFTSWPILTNSIRLKTWKPRDRMTQNFSMQIRNCFQAKYSCPRSVVIAPIEESIQLPSLPLNMTYTMNVLFPPGGKFIDGKYCKIHENKFVFKGKWGIETSTHQKQNKTGDSKNSMNLHKLNRVLLFNWLINLLFFWC